MLALYQRDHWEQSTKFSYPGLSGGTLTVIPNGPSSCACWRVSPIWPAFALAYAWIPVRLTLRPALGEAEISGPGFAWPRKIALDATMPIKIQAFVQGTIIEAFVNDQYAFTCRAYDYSQGGLSLEIVGGQMKILDLKVKTLPRQSR